MRKKEEDGMVEVGYLPIKEIPVDRLMKPLNGVNFGIFQNLIKMTNQV